MTQIEVCVRNRNNSEREGKEKEDMVQSCKAGRMHCLTCFALLDRVSFCPCDADPPFLIAS